MAVTRLREKMKTKRKLIYVVCAVISLSVLLAVGTTWAACVASDEISAQSIEAAQYTIYGELSILNTFSDGTTESEVLMPDDSGDYMLDEGAVYQLELRAEGNITSGYCTFAFTGDEIGPDAVNCYFLLAPSEETTIISFQPKVSCYFRYEYCWGIPEEDAWNGEEITLNVGEQDLVTMVAGDTLEVFETELLTEQSEDPSGETESDEPSSDVQENDTEASSENIPETLLSDPSDESSSVPEDISDEEPADTSEEWTTE